MAELILTGWRHSIYTRIARLVLAEKGLEASFIDIDPFADPKPAGLSPFGHVPVLRHGGFALHQTAAICRYLDEGFPGPALQPVEPRARARMVQVIGVADAHGYWPLVRQVYSAAVFGPAEGLARNEQALAMGLAAAPLVLAVLDGIAAEGLVLDAAPTLADLHLAPMVAAFARAPEGAALLSGFPALSRWWEVMAARPAMAATEVALPGDASGATPGH